MRFAAELRPAEAAWLREPADPPCRNSSEAGLAGGPVGRIRDGGWAGRGPVARWVEFGRMAAGTVSAMPIAGGGAVAYRPVQFYVLVW